MPNTKKAFPLNPNHFKHLSFLRTLQALLLLLLVGLELGRVYTAHYHHSSQRLLLGPFQIDSRVHIRPVHTVAQRHLVHCLVSTAMHSSLSHSNRSLALPLGLPVYISLDPLMLPTWILIPIQSLSKQLDEANSKA